MEQIDIKGLEVSVNGKKVLNGVDISVQRGKIHVLMGPNGSGKSTLANVIMGNPKYIVNAGSIKFDNEDILKLKVNERAKKGIFLAFQEPVEISGVNTMNFLVTAHTNLKGKNPELRKEIIKKMGELNLSELFLKRSLNEGFSGGEKKRFELLQVMLLNPKIAILDEIDSGMDVDSVRLLGVITIKLSKDTGFLMITHNENILDYIKPDIVSIMKDGKIIRSGDYQLIEQIKKEGYKQLI
ncbi:MAG: FeS assembly ATPase SufC [Candidatus Parvarchaeum acidiphilum ARMAN-4]|uniref:FeS assembly ATPase SufC n=1 Tax=Candidatus Parvarchaeum acidiphilum ARMAN-4 TaxID=662760 RepID=D2EGC6_PARA4|nr:MAG: FeS assembly ATPase SufC [Candidatus Parvarchaeum acidiphilum ARMAN-4]